MDFLKFHLGLPCPAFPCPAGRPPLKRPYGSFRDCSPTDQVAYDHLLPLWTPHVVRISLCLDSCSFLDLALYFKNRDRFFLLVKKQDVTMRQDRFEAVSEASSAEGKVIYFYLCTCFGLFCFFAEP
jgi:hypothetical protein